MGVVKAIITGLGIGAVAMYFGDPKKGRTRRALVRDKFDALWHIKIDADRAMVKDASNRLQGLFYKTKARFRHETPDDRKLVERVRSKIGHVISHPGALDITAEVGKIRLSGAILDSEKEDLIEEIWKVEGVESIEHQLDLHETVEGISALQGMIREEEEAASLLTGEWNPATALGFGAVGAVLAIYGMSRKGVLGTTLGTVGVALLGKSFKDVEGKRFAQKIKQNPGWG